MSVFNSCFVFRLDIVAFGSEWWNNKFECKLFDAETGKWTSLPIMNTIRIGHPGVVVVPWGPSYRVYVFGGHDGISNLNSCEFLDIGESQWTLVEETMASIRILTCAVLLDHNTVVICGGYDALKTVATCEKFDLTTQTFSSFPDMLDKRNDHCGVHYKGTIVIVGGYNVSRLQCDACEQFDPVDSKWVRIAPLNYGRSGAGAAVIEDKIYVVAGYSYGYVERYDGSVWSTVCDAPNHKESSRCAVSFRGRLVVLGHPTGIVDVLDPVTKSWNVCVYDELHMSSQMIAFSF